jgi:hypothetical protein
MQKFTPFRSALLGCAAVAILGACSGADGVASPGVGAFVPAPSTPAPPTSPGPTTPTTPPGTPAADCPAGFANIGIVASKRICQLPSLITGNLVIAERAGTVYSVSGQTRVGTDAGPSASSPLPGSQTGILTIEPGVTIFGNSGSDYLLINRGSQIFAEGTSTKPIILTSRQSVEGTTGANSIGQWGGLIVLGRAPSSDGCPSGVTPPSASCEAQVEGGNQFYGGTLAGDNSGRIRYLRVMHSGFEIAPGNELNGITLAGVGNGTVFEYVQVHNSSDDGIEIFGGTVNLRYIVLTGNDDDGFDTDSGWSGAAQFGIAYQRTGGGDFGFETSSRGASHASDLRELDDCPALGEQRSAAETRRHHPQLRSHWPYVQLCDCGAERRGLPHDGRCSDPVQLQRSQLNRTGVQLCVLLLRRIALPGEWHDHSGAD